MQPPSITLVLIICRDWREWHRNLYHGNSAGESRAERKKTWLYKYTSTPFNFLRLLFPISPFFFKFTVNYPFSYSNFVRYENMALPPVSKDFFFAGIAVFLPLQGRCTLKTLLNSILMLPAHSTGQHAFNDPVKYLIRKLIAVTPAANRPPWFKYRRQPC